MHKQYGMKTTVVFDDAVYRMLKQASREELGSQRALSEYVNKIVASFLARKKANDLFGSSKRFPLDDLRDHYDRFT